MKRLVIAALALTLVMPVTGCVKSSTYQLKVDETNLLNEEISRLQTSYRQLLEEKNAVDQFNLDLDQRLREAMAKSTALQQDLIRARADADRLEKVLSARSAEAGAAMAEMRQTIDRIEDENRSLALQVEKERLAREARVAQMKSTYDELVGMMESEIKRGEVTISELQGKLTVNMVERILFDSGKDEIKKAGLSVLQRVGDVLKGVKDKDIRVEGHTDNVAISSRLKDTFASNWELSTARATNVLHFLQDRVGLPGDRLSACGFGQYRPVADNANAEGRAQNRRIQIVLVPLEARVAKPLQ